MRRVFAFVAAVALVALWSVPALPAAARVGPAGRMALIPPPTAELVMLRANPWQWVAFESPTEAFTVDDPGNYGVTFNIDASLTIVADCNTALGWYQGEGGALSVTLGPMTAAACPPESRSDRFVRLLGSSARYFFADGHLFIDLAADGGTLEFAPAPGYGATPGGEGTTTSRDDLAAILGNLTYDGIAGSGPVTLAGGVYAYSEPGSAATPFVELVDRLTPEGDLNGDGVEDAVALLRDHSAGSGTFTFIAPVLNVLGTPAPGPATMLGDRIQVVSLAVEGGQAVADLVTQGPGEPLCCGTARVRQTFALDGDALVEQGREEQGTVSLASLNGTSWRLVGFGDAQTPPLPDTEITLAFEDGQISGSGGCNSYGATVASTDGAPQSLTIGAVAATLMGCADPVMAQEAEFFARLDNVGAWRFEDGWLVLAPVPDDPAGHLVFAPR